MKRTTLVLGTLATVGIACGHLESQNHRVHEEALRQVERAGEWERKTERLQADLVAAHSGTRETEAVIDETRREAEWISPDVQRMLQDYADGSLRRLPDKWRTVLDGQWNRSEKYVLIPKTEVEPAMSVTQVCRNDETFGLQPATAAVLGLTSNQADQVGQWASNLVTTAGQWVRASIDRSEPGDGALFKYSIPENRDAYRGLVQAHMSALAESIGTDQSKMANELLRMDAHLIDANLAGSGTTLTVWHSPTGNISYEVIQAPSVPRPYRETGVVTSPDQQMPVGFRSAFPGGWAELLAREGIALPAVK